MNTKTVHMLIITLACVENISEHGNMYYFGRRAFVMRPTSTANTDRPYEKSRPNFRNFDSPPKMLRDIIIAQMWISYRVTACKNFSPLGLYLTPSGPFAWFFKIAQYEYLTIPTCKLWAESPTSKYSSNRHRAMMMMMMKLPILPCAEKLES